MDWYVFFKWWHIVAMVSWMAGILYLIRLLVYHAQDYGKHPENHALLSLMEKRLSKYIMRPAMLITWLTGFAMIGYSHQIAQSPWFMIKLVCVILLSFVSERAAGYGKRLWNKDAGDGQKNIPSSKALRWINEIPTLLLIIIVALVLFKPHFGL